MSTAKENIRSELEATRTKFHTLLGFLSEEILNSKV